MKKLNFEKLMNLDPTIYFTYYNGIGQKVIFVEHPIYGDEYPVIAVFEEEKMAFNTEFYDFEEMAINGGDYEVLLIDAELVFGYEMEYNNK